MTTIRMEHTQAVLRLYRHALQTAGSWSASRAHYRQLALGIRARFDANKKASPREATGLLLQAQVWSGRGGWMEAAVREGHMSS